MIFFYPIKNLVLIPDMSRCKKIVENIGRVCPRITPDTLTCPLIHAQKILSKFLKTTSQN